MEERFFDTVYRVESPEGIVLELHPAGPFVRLFAWLIDSVIRSVFIFFLIIAMVLMKQFGEGIFYIGFFFITWFYPVVFELFGNGATPGKRIFGLQVIKQNGTPVDLTASLIRNLLRSVDYLPVFFGLGLFSMLICRGFRRIGDLAAGTIVIYGKGAALPAVWRAASSRTCKPIAPSESLTFSEQRALVSFTNRSAFLGEARANELASIVASVLDTRPNADGDPVASLMDITAWITGDKK